MTKACCANDTQPVCGTLQVVTSGPMLSLCADWLAVLGRQPDEIALMESFLSKAAEHHVHVPAFVIQWAVWWNSTLRAYDWECPALFSSMEQWVATHEPPPGLPPHGSSAAKKYLYLHQIGAYDSAAAAASAPALVSACVLCIAVSISSYWRMYCQILVLLPLVFLLSVM